MRARMAIFIVLAASAGCGSEAPDDALNPIRSRESPRVVSAQEALESSEITTLDPHTMNDAEIRKALGDGPFCAYRYVSDGKPVLAWKRQQDDSTPTAVVKLNGVLVGLRNEPGAGPASFVADDIRLTLTSTASRQAGRTGAEHPQPAQMLFEIKSRLRVGYGGYSACPV